MLRKSLIACGDDSGLCWIAGCGCDVVDRLWAPRSNIVPFQPLVGFCQRKSTPIRCSLGWLERGLPWLP